MDSRVLVYVYDLSRGLARSLSSSILGTQIDGIWHTGVVVYNQEYFFGGQGVESCAPGHTILGNPNEIVDLGITEIPFEIFWDHLHELSKTTFRARDYNLLRHNCNNFSSELAQFLTGQDIPAHITNLPSEVLSSPFGQMIRPFLESMTVDPGNEVEPCFSSSSESQCCNLNTKPTQHPESSCSEPADQANSSSASYNSNSNNSDQNFTHHALPLDSQASSQSLQPKEPAVAASAASAATKAVQAITYPVIQELSLAEFRNADRTAITILLDYQSEKNPDWSVSPKHLIKLKDAIETDDGEVAWRLFHGLVLHSALTSALYASYEPLQSVLTSECVNARKLVCNLSSHTEGVNFINGHPAVIQDLFSSTHTSNVFDNQPRVATAFNISNLYEPATHDLDIALTSGLVEYLNSSLINRCVESPQPVLLTQLETAMKALINFMNKNTEMKDLVKCLELDLETIQLVTNTQSDEKSLKNTTAQLSGLLN